MNSGSGLGISQQYGRSAFDRQINYYVDSVLGNDSYAGTNDHPFRTFQYAIDMADESRNPGANNIYLKEGNYGGVTINDDDMLKIIGMGHEIWDVTVGGDSAMGDTIRIGGGKDVRLFNLQVTGSSANGIYARDLEYVFLHRVFSNFNSGDGFFGDNVVKTKIYSSFLSQNGRYGAHVEGGNLFRSVDSNFDGNNSGGISLTGLEKAELIGTSASNNGSETTGEELVANAVGVSGNGMSATGIGQVLINGGHYNSNFGVGIIQDRVWNTSLLDVEAASNSYHGVSSNYFNRAFVDGGRFADNFGSGLVLTASFFEGLTFAERYAGVFDSQLSNNSLNGLQINNAQHALLSGIDSRWNGNNGMAFAFVAYLHVFGSFMFRNNWNGLFMSFVGQALVNGLTAKFNLLNGLLGQNGDRVNVIGGSYCHNSLWGINCIGNQEQLMQRVDVKYATVLGNFGGLFVAYAYLGKLVGGSYRENTADGILMSNVLRGIFYHIVVKYNGGHGLRFDAGLMQMNGSDPVDPAAAAAAEYGNPFFDRPNWNNVELMGGLYCHNGYDGIYIGTAGNNGTYANTLIVQSNFVVSRDNGYTGFNVGGRMADDYEGTGSSSSNLYLTMRGGYYGFNGYDGIYLLGAAPEEPTVGMLTAKMVDVVAEFNGGYGVNASGNLAKNGWYGYELEDRPNQYSLIQLTRGSYSFNEAGGAVFQLSGGMALGHGESTGENHHVKSIATFDHVVANNNKGNGVWLDANLTLEGESDHGGVNGSTPLVKFWGGSYTANRYNGVSMTSSIVGLGALPDLSDYIGVSFENVVANANEQDGFSVINFTPDTLRYGVELKGVISNVNQWDGAFLQGLGNIPILGSTFVSNRDDGIHSRNNLLIFVTATLVDANGSLAIRREQMDA